MENNPADSHLAFTLAFMAVEQRLQVSSSGSSLLLAWSSHSLEGSSHPTIPPCAYNCDI